MTEFVRHDQGLTLPEQAREYTTALEVAPTSIVAADNMPDQQESTMAADYDAPRNAPENDDNVVSIDARPTKATGLAADLDDGDSADGFELDAAIVDEALDVVVLPIQENEFTCVECFLVRPRVQLDHESKLGPVCVECAS